MAQSPIRFVAPSPGPATDLASTPPPPSLFRRESPTTAAMRAEREALERSLSARRSTVKPVPVRPGVTAKPPAALERGPLEMATDFAGDSARSLLGRGTIGTGEGAVGLANIATALSPVNIGARAASALLNKKAPDLTLNPVLDAVGYQPQVARDYISEFDSEALKRARAEVEKAQGFLPTVEASLRNPSTIVQSAIESVPSMLAGQGVASGALKVAPGMAPILASALGEGALTAGQNAEQTRQESGTLTPGQAGAAVAAGGVTAGISRVAGRLAEKAGLADPDTLILAGRAASEKPRGLAARMIGGAISEGLLEEAPQSAQEQAFQNLAQGRPLGEGVMESAAQGMLTGGLMGAGSNVMPQRQAESVDNPDAPPPQYDAEDDFTSALLNPSIGPAQALAMGETAPPAAPPAPVPAPAPSIRPSDVAGQIVWDAESQGRSPLSALIDSGLSTKDAKAVLASVRAKQPKAAAVPAPDASKVDAEQDKAAAARRAEAKSPAPAPAPASRPTPRNATPEEEDRFLREAHDAVNRAASEQLRAEREARAERFATPWDNRFASGAAPAAEAPTADPFGQAERNSAFGLASSGSTDVSPAPSPFEAKQEQFARGQSEQQQAAEDAFYRQYAQDNGHAALVDALRTREGLSTSAAVEDAKAIEDGRPRKKRKPKPAQQAAPADAAPSDAAGTPTSPQAASSSPRDASAQAPDNQAQAGKAAAESSPAAGTPERSSEPSPSSAPRPQVGESSDVVASTPRGNEGSTAAQESEQVDDIAAENTDSSADVSTTVTARGRDFEVKGARIEDGRRVWVLRGKGNPKFKVAPAEYKAIEGRDGTISVSQIRDDSENPFGAVTFENRDGQLRVKEQSKVGVAKSSKAVERGTATPDDQIAAALEASIAQTAKPGNRGGEQSAQVGGERQPAVSPANKGALLEGPIAVDGADDIVVRPPVEGSRDNQPVADDAPEVSQGSAPQSVRGPGRPVSEADPQKDQRAKQGDEGGQSTESLPPKAKTTPAKSDQKEGQKYEFSSTQADLPPAFAAAVRSLAAKIPDSALAGDGRESDPHVTVKFGTVTNDAADVRKVLEGQGPITITFGKLSTFPPSESSDGAAVLKLDIYSSDLQALNKRIGDALDNTETFKYSPHVTVAYVDPAQADAVKAKLSNPLNGKTVKIDRLSFSDRQGEKHEIKLVAEPKGMDGLTKTQRAEKKSAARPEETIPGGSLAVGDRLRMMKSEVVVKERTEDNGIEYTLSSEVDGPKGFVKVKDLDSGNVIRMGSWPTYAAAEADYLKAIGKAPKATLPDPKTAAVKTRIGTIDLTTFLANGRKPWEVTQDQWIELQRAERRRLGQQEGGDNPNVPNFEYKAYHEDSVKQAIADKQPVSGGVLKDYPNLRPKRTVTITEAEITPTRGGVVATPIATEPVEPTPEAEPTASQAGINRLSTAVFNRIDSGEGIKNNPELTKMAELAFGGTRASGKWSPKDAYDALEMGVNRWLNANAKSLMEGDPRAALERLRGVLALLPTQTDRTREQQDLQQFSTPPTEAYVAARALGIRPGETVLEPSAGNGGLAVFAKGGGAKVVVNEISPRRAEILKSLGFEVTSVDAENLNALLPKEIVPDSVLMNPPFSSTGGRLKSNKTEFGARHVEQALARMKPGGRLVAIVGQGMAMNRPAFAEWWKKIGNRYNVVANYGIPGEEYGKYGTTFGNQIIVIDKTSPNGLVNVKHGDLKSLEEALDALDAIGKARRLSVEPASALGDGRTQSSAGDGAVETASGQTGSGVRKPGRLGSPRRPSSGGKETVGKPSTVVQDVPEQGRPRPAVSAATEGTGKPDETVRDVVSEGGRAGLRPAGRVGFFKPEAAKKEPSRRELPGGSFVEARPQRLDLSGIPKHPASVVEPSSLASVSPPPITYEGKIPESLAKDGDLSDLQLEAALYAGQRHSQALPGGQKAGFLIGDGPGVGKTRELATITLDNWNQGRKRTLWLSVGWNLVSGVRDGLNQVGAEDIPLHRLDSIGRKDAIQFGDGVLFATYSTFREPERIAQVQEWLGDSPVIHFDEAHKAKNLVGEMGEPTKTGAAVLKIQNDNPNALVTYASATAATEPRNMGYMVRLGLWGPGTAFPTFNDFRTAIETGGVGAMEMISRDVKALGIGISRGISMEGVEFRETVHNLTQEQKDVYNRAARLWQEILKRVDDAIQVTGGKSFARMRALSQFYGAMQRFFKAVATSSKVPTLIRRIEEELKDGRSIVVRLVSTAEGRTEDQVAKAKAEGVEIDDLDITPRETIVGYIENSFPTTLYQDYTDPDTGQTMTRPVLDADGNMVQDPEAVAMRDELLRVVSDLRLPEHPLDQMLKHFGVDKIAEVTGRSKRLITNKVTGRREWASRSPKSANAAERDAFQGGKKRILLLNDSGGTGMDAHADNKAKNKQQRVYFIFETGWSADNELQALGRVNRTNQASAPIYDLVSTDLSGERRFYSTIAKRLEQLGALSRGDRSGVSAGGLADFNFENDYGKGAAKAVYDDLEYDDPDTLRQMGFVDPKTGNVKISTADKTDVPRFLNRVLALEVDKQAEVFGNFERAFAAIVQKAKDDDAYDSGVSDLKAERVTVVGKPTVVSTDPTSGASTEHVELSAEYKTYPMSWASSQGWANKEGSGYYTNDKSGRVFLAVKSANSTNTETGRIEQFYRLFRPNGSVEHVPESELRDRFTKDGDPKDLWDKEYAEAPKTRKETVHLITGVTLPIWDKLGTRSQVLKVVRTETEGGKRFVGVKIPTKEVGKVLKALNVRTVAANPAQVFESVNGGATVDLDRKLRLSRVRVRGENRIEITSKDFQIGSRAKELVNLGALEEKIDFRFRYFIPDDTTVGVGVLERLLKAYPVIEGGEDAPRFERKPAAPEFSRPTFYSALERSAEQMKQPMMAHDAARFLLDPKRGAKAAEAKWTGLDDFLGVQWQDGKMSVTDPVKARRRVTPAEVQDFLKANAVTVKEVSLTKRAATMTESQWQHYNARHDADRGESAREAYRRSETVNGAPTGVRVVDFEGDVDKQVVSMMVQWSAAIASKMGAAVHMLQRHVPALKFGGVTPAGNLHGVNVDGKVFVNYLATHQLALEVAKKERITYEEAFAREAVNVLIHEAAHYAEKGHGPAFEAEMDRIKADLGPQALASMLRDFRKYAANDQNRTRTQRMYEKAAPGWIEGERRGREAAANTGAAGARGADAQQSERLRPRPRSDTGGDQDSFSDDEPAGGVRMARRTAPVDVAGAPGLRRPDGRGIDPSFSRKPSASTPGLVAQQEANSDRLFRAFIRKQGGDIGDNETKGQYLQRKTQNRLNRLDRAESDARERRGDTSAPILADRFFGGQARIDNKLTVTESVLLDPLMKSIRSNGLNFDLLGSYMQGKPDAIESVQKSGKRAKYDEAAAKIDAIYAVSDSYRIKRGLVTPEELDDIRAKREKARAASTAHPIFDALQDFERVIIQDEHNTGLQAVAAFAEEANDPGFARVSKVGQDGPRPNSVVFRRDGREWQIDFSSPEVADSVRKPHADSMNAVARFVSKGTRWVSRVNTVLSPAFMIKNKIRDFAGAVLSAMVLQGAPNGVSKSVAAKIIGGQGAAMRGTRDYIKNPAGKFEQGSAGWWAQQAHKNAAVPGYFRSIESLQRLESRLGDTLRGKMARKISFRHFSDVMMALSELSEASTRVSVYRALVESGVTPAKAGDMARQTLDTNKTGDWTRNIGAITPFFNSSVQGAARLAQMMTSKDPGVRRRARAMMGGLVAAGAMLGAWLAASGGDDDKDGIPDSDQQPEWDTQRNLIIGGVKIPLPQGFSAPFYAGFMLSKLGRGNAKPAEAMFQVGKAFWDQFTPISSPFGVAQPAADLLQNQTFTGAPIRPIRYPGDTRPNSEKFFKSNTGAAKAIAKGLNRATFGDESESGYIDFYPGDIDYVAKAGMGSFGRFMADSARAVEAIMDGKPVKKIPVVGDFLVDEDRNIQSRYYDAASMIRDADDRRRGKQRMAMRQELSERYPGSSEKIEGASLTELRKAMRDTGATLSPERGAWLKAELEEQDGRALKAKAAFEEASDRLKALDNMPDGPDKDEKRRAIYEAANRAFVAAVKVQ